MSICTQVIELCEELSDSRASVTTVPTWLLKRVRSFLQSLQWAKDAADRLVGAAQVERNEKGRVWELGVLKAMSCSGSVVRQKACMCTCLFIACRQGHYHHTYKYPTWAFYCGMHTK